MNTRVMAMLRAIGTGAAALLLQCVNPFGGGGTETSNPGMFACAYAVFDEVESPLNWSPESYLPDGGIELDPDRSLVGTARRKTGILDAVPKGSNLILVSSRVDTTITIDSLCIDTFPGASAAGDTIRIVMIDGPDTVAEQKLPGPGGNGSLCVKAWHDTALTAVVDSFLIQLTETPNAPLQVMHTTVAGMRMERNRGVLFPHAVSMDSCLGYRTVIADFAGRRSPKAGVALSPFVHEAPYARLMNTSHSFGYGIGETYTPVSVPAQRSGVPEMRLLAFLKQPRGVCTALSMHFDAGKDRRFGSIGDNRILRLDREQTLANHTLERIVFRNLPALETGDSIECIVDKHQDSGLVKDASIRYVSLPAILNGDHRAARIARITKALSFRKSRVQSIDLCIEFSGDALPFYDKATVTARMYYGQGREGIFKGVINGRANALAGRYLEDEKEDEVEYRRAGNTLSWKDSKIMPPLSGDRPEP